MITALPMYKTLVVAVFIGLLFVGAAYTASRLILVPERSRTGRRDRYRWSRRLEGLRTLFLALLVILAILVAIGLFFSLF